jgi:hypothetical protein
VARGVCQRQGREEWRGVIFRHRVSTGCAACSVVAEDAREHTRCSVPCDMCLTSAGCGELATSRAVFLSWLVLSDACIHQAASPSRHTVYAMVRHTVCVCLHMWLCVPLCCMKVWSVGASGERYQRWWGEQHLGDRNVRRHGHSTTG